MPNSQKFMRSIFGYAAIIFGAVFVTLLPVIVGSPLPHATPRFHADTIGLLLIAMRELILVMPPVVAIVNGMAWWSLRKSAPSARWWAIAASVSLLVLSAPFFDADVAIMQYGVVGIIGFTGILLLSGALLLLGSMGLAAFRKRDGLFAADRSIPSIIAGGSTLAPTV